MKPENQGGTGPAANLIATKTEVLGNAMTNPLVET